MILGADGRAHDIRVQRSLGMGLDESATETVKTWIFEPATKDGKPIAVPITVVTTFKLWESK
jgi:protein TonB